MKNLLVLATLISMSVSAGGALQPGNYKHRTDWKKVYEEEGFKASCTIKVPKTIKVEGTLDLKGCLYVWTGKGKENCHAADEIGESEPRMFEMAKGSKLRNGQIECSPDGVLMNDDTEISNILFRDCEEDCITTKGKGNVIRNNKFFLAQDKAVQMNQATNVEITSNTFKHVLRGLSGSGSSTGGADGIVATGNTFKNAELAFRAQSDHDIRAKNNVIDGGEALFETANNAVIYDCGGNEAKGGATKMAKDGTKNVKSCPK